MKAIKRLIIAALAPVFLLTGCELAGLELQQKYDYDKNAGMLSNELNMTVWEFVNSRPDLFSTFIEAVKHAGLEGMYNQPNSTYLVLTNAAFNTAVTGYLNRNPLPNPNYDPNDPSTGQPTAPAFSIDQLPKEKVKQMLLYHIVKGTWSWNNLPPVPTWYDTNAAADTAKVNLYLMKNDRSPTIGFNSFPTHYEPVVRARTTNLKAKNGSFVHVMDFYLEYPTRVALQEK
ncbi:fasciclin domain-containing protein [Botryobacter ruber]|uniref:fasciclin domain-containing protein n=1 Tax=Botryobacter ruber TaxID=2171629 RepID=UPI000E0BB7FE|nr:fasciclin domain-containing protein [Botryobacter ruber]